VLEALHGAIQEIAEKMFELVIIPMFEDAFTCKSSKWFGTSSRSNIITLRVCGAKDPTAFCPCTLGFPPGWFAVKEKACRASMTHLNTAMSLLSKAGISLNTIVTPRLERKIAYQAISRGYFKGDKGQDIIAAAFVNPDEIDKWSDETAACDSAKWLIGDGETNLGQTAKEKAWAKMSAEIKKELEAQKKEGKKPDDEKTQEEEVKKDQPKSEFCQARPAIDKQLLARRLLSDIFR
jgi:hypothetical protein